MGALDTAVEPRAQSYLDNRAATLAALARLESALDAARDGGGERAATRHHARGKLLARERIELLVDRDSPLLELSPVAAWGSDCPVGAGIVVALGVVEDRICVLVANDPTVRGGALTSYGMRKLQRAGQIAQQNRLPLISLLEPAGIDPAHGDDVFVHGGELIAALARLAAAWIPTVGVFFGPAQVETVAPARCFDYLVAVRHHAGAYPPAADQAGYDQAGYDHLAEDERDAVRLARQYARRFPPAAVTPPAAPPPQHDPDDLLAISPGEPREILARLLDASEFDEMQPAYGAGVCAGWGAVHGYPMAVLADTGHPAGEAEVRKTERFIRRVEMAGVPLVLLRHNRDGHAGTEAALATAVADAAAAVISVRTGDWWGAVAGDADARFRFAWPHTTAALDSSYTDTSALHLSGRLHDDGVIDPRDTRTVLGICLAVVTGATP